MSTITAIDCDDALLLAAASDERSLTSDESRELQAHLRDCRVCEEGADSTDEEWVSISRLPLEEISGAELGNLPVVDPGVYEWGELIGAGGMGQVVSAHDRRLGRRVAIKELRSGGPRDRFETEAKITARLQHPAIVSIHEAGRWPSGEPFYSMKLVEGSPLSDEIRAGETLAERIALLPEVMSVVDAIAYAHSQGVVHRDIKPSNIVLGPYGETVVIDWGLAKQTTDLGDETAGPFRGPSDGATQAGLGTPQYMSPEQAWGKKATTEADVYSLGATLYHLLAGRPPYRAADAHEILELLDAGPPTPLDEIEPEVPADLAAIVAKAMARNPSERYATATELAEDLRRFQAGQLVGAFDYSWWQLLCRWVSRNRRAVIAGVMILSIGAIGAATSINKIIDARDDAEEKRSALALYTNLEQGRAEMIDDQPMRAAPYLAAAFREAALPAVTLLLGQAMRTSDAQLLRIETGGQVGAVARSQAGELAVSVGSNIEIWSSSGERRRVLDGHEHEVTDLDWSDLGLASASLDNTVRLWGEAARVFYGHGHATRVVAGFEDSLLSAGDDGTLRRWSEKAGALDSRGSIVAALDDPDLRIVALDASGELALARGRWGEGLVLIEAGSAEPVEIARGEVGVAAIAGDRIALSVGRRVALRKRDGAQVVDRLVHRADVTAAAFDSNADRLVTGDKSGQLVLWDAKRGSVIARTQGHRSQVTDLAIRENHLVSGGRDGAVAVWDLDALAELGFAETETRQGIPKVAGDRLAFVTRDRLDIVGTAGELSLRGKFTGASLEADGQLRIAAIDDQVVSVHDRAGNQTVQLVGHSNRVTAVAFADDIIVTASRDGTARIWDAAGVERAILRGHEGPVEHVAVGGGRVVTGGFDGTIRIWSLSGDLLTTLPEHTGPVHALALSVDGRLIASASSDPLVRIWDVELSREVTSFQLSNPVEALAMGRSESRLAIASGGEVTMWDLELGAPLFGLVANGTVKALELNSAQLVAVGQRIATFTLPREPSKSDLGSRLSKVPWRLVRNRLLPTRPLPGAGRLPLGGAPVERTYDFSSKSIAVERLQPNLSPPAAAERDYRRAWQALDAGKPDEAVAAMSKAIEVWSDRPLELGVELSVMLSRSSVSADRAFAAVLEAAPGNDAWLQQLSATFMVSRSHGDAAAVARMVSGQLRDATQADVTRVNQFAIEVWRGELDKAVAHLRTLEGEYARDIALAGAAELRKRYESSGDERFGRAARDAFEVAGATEQASEVARSLASDAVKPNVKKIVRDAFESHIGPLRDCYQRVLQRQPETSGELVVNGFVDNLGEVTEVVLEPRPGRFGLAAVSTCIERRIRRWRIPRMPDGSTIYWRQPLDFAPASTPRMAQ